MRILRVLHLNTERTWRGGEQQMCYLACGLRERGHVSHVLCRPGSACRRRAGEMRLEVHQLAIHGDLDVFAAWRVARLAGQLEVDILHAHTSRAHLAAVWAKHFCKRELRCVVHRRVDFSIHKLPFRLSGLKYRSGVDRYIAVTDAVRQVMIRDGIDAGKISVIHSATDLSRFAGLERSATLRKQLGIPDGARVVGNVGWLVGHKDHYNLLDAAALVLKKFPDAFFVIIGEGPLREELEARAAALGIGKWVSMPGFRPDVPQCLAQFDVFCLSSWGEGIGGVVLEAMAAKLPVVTTSAGGLAEVVRDGENGILVPTRDSTALARAICRMLRDPGAALAMAGAGRRTVESDFTVDGMVEKTIAIYEEVMGGGLPVE